VAFHTATGESRLRAEIASTAQAALWVLAVAALLVVAIAAWLLPYWFPGMPEALTSEARIALILMGAGIAIGLPATAAAGVYTGLQRNEIPAMFIVVSRAAIAAAVIALAAKGAGLVPIAAAYGGIVAIAAVAQLLYAARNLPELALRHDRVTRRAGSELISYCTSMTIWSMGMLVISGLDAVIAAHFDFRWAGYYAVAASVSTLLVGLQAAVLQPFIAISASLHSRGERTRLGAMLVELSYLNTLLFMMLCVVVLAAGGPLLRLWLGDDYGDRALAVVQIVLAGILLRQTMAPYATVLLGTGEQRLVVWTPLYEAGAKLATSIALAAWLGPIGVALGTVIGAIVCIASNLVLTYPRARGFDAALACFAWRGLLRPALLFAPLCILAAFVAAPGKETSLPVAATVVAVAIAFGVACAFPAVHRLRELV
jgi:O-antigen/teichoic acid export membrane protein